MKDTYVPGVCNIGPKEIQKRMTVAWVGFLCVGILWGIFVVMEVAPAYRLLVGIPAFMSAMGFIQARLHFCAYYGLASLFNFGDVGKTDTVSQASFRAQDRKRALKIIAGAVSIGIVVALIAYKSA